MINKAFKEKSSEQIDERKNVLNEINALNKKVSDARELVLNGSFDANDFRTVKLESEKRIAVLESKLPEISKSLINIRADLTKAISNLQEAENQFNIAELK